MSRQLVHILSLRPFGLAGAQADTTHPSPTPREPHRDGSKNVGLAEER